MCISRFGSYVFAIFISSLISIFGYAQAVQAHPSNQARSLNQVRPLEKIEKKSLTLWQQSIVTTLSSALPSQDNFELQYRKSWIHLIDNLNYSGLNPGVVIASPSQTKPNYFYHWVRDAGLVVREVIGLYHVESRPQFQEDIRTFIRNWISIEIQHQKTAESSNHGLGEPIFTVNGSIYPYAWGRPQTDGPAIRAIAMLEWADILRAEGHFSELANLYKAELPATTPIKRDLEFIAHHWQDLSFDLWEEVQGQHFFTLMAQRRALKMGALLAQSLNDSGASDYYLRQAHNIESRLQDFFNPQKGYLVATLAQVDGWKNKLSNLDTSVILGSIYFSMGDGFLTPDSEEVKLTAMALLGAFQDLYAINKNNLKAPAIGRYKEDVYDGSGFSGGNPWFITTQALAEWSCLTSRRWPLVQNEFSGWDFLQRTLDYTDKDGHLSEQVQRDSGNMVGAIDLSWSYASYIRAFRICSQKN